MATRKAQPTWTDREVALLLKAQDIASISRSGLPGFEHARQFVAKLQEATAQHATAAYGATVERDVTRRALKAIVRQINTAPVNLRAAIAQGA